MERLLIVASLLAWAGTGSANEEIMVDLPGGATLEMVWIEAGTFMLGSPLSEEDRLHREGPLHEVTISQGFYLGEYEVTQGQWEGVMGTTPWSGESYVQANRNHPAVQISWNDVQEFIGRLNDAAGEGIYRLPIEAEWEYSCRAGTTTRWSFGDDEHQLGDYAWYDDNAWNAGVQYAHEAGAKRPNPWGLHDMHGNCWEWVQDWYGEYSSDAQVDPTGPASGFARVVRGGSWNDNARNVRSAFRGSFPPDDCGYGVGFRLLRVR